MKDLFRIPSVSTLPQHKKDILQAAQFLADELTERLKAGPVGFRVVVQLAGDGDTVTDSTAIWPSTGTARR